MGQIKNVHLLKEKFPSQSSAKYRENLAKNSFCRFYFRKCLVDTLFSVAFSTWIRWKVLEQVKMLMFLQLKVDHCLKRCCMVYQYISINNKMSQKYFRLACMYFTKLFVLLFVISLIPPSDKCSKTIWAVSTNLYYYYILTFFT